MINFKGKSFSGLLVSILIARELFYAVGEHSEVGGCSLYPVIHGLAAVPLAAAPLWFHTQDFHCPIIWL